MEQGQPKDYLLLMLPKACEDTAEAVKPAMQAVEALWIADR